jgi:cyanate lyase
MSKKQQLQQQEQLENKLGVAKVCIKMLLMVNENLEKQIVEMSGVELDKKEREVSCPLMLREIIKILE